MRRSRKRRLKSACAAVAYAALGALLGARFLRPKAPPHAIPGPVSGPESALDRVIPEVDLEGVPFDKAIEWVRRLTNAPIVVDWKSLSSINLDRRVPVTFRARNATLARVLEELCHLFTGPDHGAGFGPVDDVILLSTREDVTTRTTSVRAYDVRKLIAEFASDPWVDEPRPTIPDFAPRTPLPAASRSSSLVEDLVMLVEDSVASDSWRENGGTVGSVRYFAGRLVVTQTWENHRQIADLLARMRSPAPRAEPAPPRPDLMLWDARLGRYVSAQSNEGESALGRRLAEVRIDALPLDEAVAALAHMSHANIASNWQAIASAGMNPHAPVTLHLNNVTLADALRALFTAAGGDKLCFDPDGAYVRLTSHDDAGRPVTTRTYDFRDCLEAAIGSPPAVGARRREWQEAKDLALESLNRSIQDTVAPDSWKAAGGQVGAIKEWKSRLVVTQTWENQQKVADLLSALRADPARLRATLATQPTPTTAPTPAGGTTGGRSGP